MTSQMAASMGRKLASALRRRSRDGLCEKPSMQDILLEAAQQWDDVASLIEHQADELDHLRAGVSSMKEPLDTPIPGPTITLKNGEEYLKWRRGQGLEEHLSKHLDIVFAELARLREIEAREAVVVNLMAAWVEVIDGKLTVDRFEEFIQRSDAQMCRAIECLGKRDKIRKLEGSVEVFRSLRERYHDERPGTHGRWVSAKDVEHCLDYYTNLLTEARAGK